MTQKKLKFACFITVRTGSSRLPEKALLSIRGKRVIEHGIDRAKLIKEVDSVVLCTSTDPSDDVLETIAKQAGIKCFRGSLSDKLVRWLGAADKLKIDYFVNFDADDIFCDPALADLAVTQMKERPCDLLMVPPTLACGAAGMCISAQAIINICQAKGTEDTENWDYFFTQSGLPFNIRHQEVPNQILHNPDIRLTLDYQEDLDLFRRIFDEFKTDTNNIPVEKIVKLLNRKPELAKINFFRHQYYLNRRENKKA